MPEGPEVYILAKVLKAIGFECGSKGKHLFYTEWETGTKFDLSFGLSGKVRLEPENEMKLIKYSGNDQLFSGYEKRIDSFPQGIRQLELGVDWMYATRPQIESIVDQWCIRKKMVGALLIEQEILCGIGVTWASEILFRAGISPADKAHMLEFLNLKQSLIESIISVRDEVKEFYKSLVPWNRLEQIKFVNDWFDNLYNKRSILFKVVGRGGSHISVSGRQFWV